MFRASFYPAQRRDFFERAGAMLCDLRGLKLDGSSLQDFMLMSYDDFGGEKGGWKLPLEGEVGKGLGCQVAKSG